MTGSFPKTTAAIENLGRALIELYRDKLAADGNMNSELYSTIRYSVRQGNGGFTITVTLEEYWKYIEYGRKPGKMPPREKILSWIKKKPIMPRSMTLRSGRTVVPSVPQLSFLIARKIGRDGIDPKPYFSQSLDQAKRLYVDAISEALKADIEDMYAKAS